MTSDSNPTRLRFFAATCARSAFCLALAVAFTSVTVNPKRKRSTRTRTAAREMATQGGRLSKARLLTALVASSALRRCSEHHRFP